MLFYFCHSSAFDYKKELYEPLRKSPLNKAHQLVLAHEPVPGVAQPANSKSIIKASDIVFAEVSLASTGLGIQLGWAESAHIPIVCFFKKGTEVSASLKEVSKYFLEYSNPADMVAKLTDFIGRIEFE